MESGHILRGRPWQFDRRVQHDGFTNRFSFEYKGRKSMLALMKPQEVYQDQVHLKTRAETIANKESENVINSILNKEEPPQQAKQAPSQESPKEATTRALGGFTQAKAVLVHNQLPRSGHSFETNEKSPYAS
ncbi:hypothetical protein V5N11_008332 [Cardamine amara subsp. amara]|uniref:Uncharacterized protein n=1 Tax=Cardamine amara subsp. amara TaxID=228776 RepID=A0ABD0ZXK9_CARAN